VQRFSQLAARLRARIVFPVLAVAMGVSALATGVERASFVAGSTETMAPKAPVQLTYLSSSVKASDLAIPVTNVASGMLDIHTDHPRIEKWVARLTTTLKGDLKQSLDRMDKYAGMINAKLDARQMPRELAYLALIESNFNPTARSRVSAVGMWQFMSATARQFGLKVRGGVDERKNPAKSTDAALTYLSQLHDRFGSWYLAAAAYNSGAAPCRRRSER
jgi:hypothetical protein